MIIFQVLSDFAPVNEETQHNGQEEGIHDPREEEEAAYPPQEEGRGGAEEGAGEEGRGTSPRYRREMRHQGRK